MRAHSLLSLALALTGCSAVVADIGSFTESESACRQDGNRNSVRDFTMEFRELSPHTSHYFEVDVVDANEGRLQSRIILDQPGGEELTHPGTMLIRLPGQRGLVRAAGRHINDATIDAAIRRAA